MIVSGTRGRSHRLRGAQISLLDGSECSHCRSTTVPAVHFASLSSGAGRPCYVSGAALPAVLHMESAWLIADMPNLGTFAPPALAINQQSG